MKYLLLVAILLFLVITPWCVYKVGRRNRLSISQHIALDSQTIWLFGLIGTIATIFASMTLFGVTLGDHGASMFMYVVFAVIVIEMLTSVTIPYIEGTWRGNVHNVAAWGLCFSIPFVTALSLLMKLNSFVFWYTIATLGVELILLFMALSRPGLRKWFLEFQSSYLILFFCLLAVITYA